MNIQETFPIFRKKKTEMHISIEITICFMNVFSMETGRMRWRVMKKRPNKRADGFCFTSESPCHSLKAHKPYLFSFDLL